MSETHQILSVIKKALKSKGITYRELSQRLEVSEPTVKRLFSTKELTMSRLEQICGVIDLSLFDVLKLASPNHEHMASILSLEQERALAEDARLFAYFYKLCLGLGPSEIRAQFGVSPKVESRFLIKLEKLRLAERQVGEKVKLMVGRSLDWMKKGPLVQKYGAQAKREFISSEFQEKSELFEFFPLFVSPETSRVIFRKLERMAAEIRELSKVDSAMPNRNVTRVWLQIAGRPWQFSQVDAILGKGSKNPLHQTK